MNTTSACAVTKNNSASSAVLSSFRHPGFVLCLIALTSLTVAFYVITWNTQFRKLAAPLRKPLADLNKKALVPYEFVSARSIAPEVIDSLGTDQYLDWMLLNKNIGDNRSPVKRIHLFITYYTGQPDQVPHVPDVCYQGGGYVQQAAGDENLHVSDEFPSVPVRVLEFEKNSRAGTIRSTVLYTFRVNNTFANDRTGVRMTINNPLEKFAYFSKIEVQFDSGDGQPANREQSLEAARHLFKILLEELAASHWPDWDALHKKPSTETGSPPQPS